MQTSSTLERMDPVEVRAQLEKEIYQDSYYEFFKAAWPHVEPRELIDEKYVRFLCDHMQTLMLGELSSNRLLINIPPGHSKSMILVVMSLPWLWTRDPTAYSIFAHKDQAIMRDMARKTRTVITSRWYQDRWPIKILDDAKKIDRFVNEVGGGRVGVTVRQQITGSHAKGEHGGLIVIDDPDRPDDSDGDTEEVQRWYSQVLPTRFASLDESQIAIVQQRISQRDLSGMVLDSEEGYTHVCLPMEYDPERKCVTELGEDWRSEKGQLLSPLRNTPETIARLKEVFKDPRIAEAQLNQQPVSEDGAYFAIQHFQNRYHQLPPIVNWTLSCDLTFTGEKTSDYAVIQAWARNTMNGKHYMDDQIRRRMGFVETTKTLLNLLKTYPRANILVEKSANGFATVEMLIEAGVDKHRIHEFAVGRNSKEARASTVSYLFDRGDVLYPHRTRYDFDEYVRELTGFPNMRHDDQVDATTQYLAWITGSKPVDLAAAFRYAGEFSRNLK